MCYVCVCVCGLIKKSRVWCDDSLKQYSTYLTLEASMINAVTRTGALMATPWSLSGVKPTGALDHVLGAPAGRLVGWWAIHI